MSSLRHGRFAPRDDDKPRDRCGIFGVFGHPHASRITYYGLLALQHRGQEGSGIVTLSGGGSSGKARFHVHKDFGLVNDVFRDDRIIDEQLQGDAAIGHNRYSTAGSADNRHNIQPLTVHTRGGIAAVSHNGNLTNFRALRIRLEEEGTIFQTTSDTEIILHLMAKSRREQTVDRIVDALNQVEGAFSLLLLTDHFLVAARDPHGWRPLAVGRLGRSFVVASETCAFDIVNAEYLCDVAPGEVLVFDRDALGTGKPAAHRLNGHGMAPHHCIFEYIYFSRPDSRIFGESVDRVRRKLGKALAREHPVAADTGEERTIVINVPDSSNTATLGFVNESAGKGGGGKYEIGLIRSHYVGRTFIDPEQDQREMKVRAKFNTVRGVIKGRKVVIVDDSIVRGTTSRQLVRLIREAGASEIHLRITSPPIRHPCHYGMDFPSPAELVANRCGGDLGEIRRELGVDSLGYLSLEALLDAAPHGRGESYCTACFSGEYPTPVPELSDKNEHEL